MLLAWEIKEISLLEHFEKINGDIHKNGQKVPAAAQNLCIMIVMLLYTHKERSLKGKL